MTSQSTDKGWQLSEISISANGSIPGRILAPLYENGTQKEILYAMYNDQTPNKKPSSSVWFFIIIFNQFNITKSKYFLK